ncbi:MAG: CDP-2,3-bis-(O-geranylgeranyl)-sn-glycerol synthase [Desulfurococcales archaeon]|jgi:CDP-2,3-bis-(O-geranylgeranyl)-sn-glycerol synthase|nr:CDP-2,3-bis-(O-geranylgeranyl)-sn-glycerol synthase [Desulfurococcales archaeon]
MVNIDDLPGLMVKVLFIYFPAMAANGAPVFIKKGTPIDLGKTFVDGKRVLGDGKTYEGLLVGIMFGSGVGAIYTSALGNPAYIIYSLVSSIGALLGDIIGAFIKRRLGIPRGAPAPLLDQLSFYLFANLLIKITGLDVSINHIIGVWEFIFGALIVFILHISTNWGAYKLGIKSVPY